MEVWWGAKDREWEDVAREVRYAASGARSPGEEEGVSTRSDEDEGGEVGEGEVAEASKLALYSLVTSW